MPMCFNIGIIIGPVLGGILSDPAGSYPSVFGPGSTFGGQTGVWWMMNWPYLTPNLVSASIVLLSLITVLFGLDEVSRDLSRQPGALRAYMGPDPRGQEG